MISMCAVCGAYSYFGFRKINHAAGCSGTKPRWEFPAPIPETWFEFCLFAPRWHGWARWEYAVAVPFTAWTYGREVVAHGWTRRPKGSRYVTINTRPEDASDASKSSSPGGH